ncbi:hypothetical protein [Staphylococcus devriesei]|uniref:hypothetical protein n=1 Tax=Staphylococcus devriesei TaxID=586733 RepID=UPI00267495B7|nr:hypothetical protein [Staphylococcus devriesei]WKU13038.1 hypothetical protein Q2T90_09825 [Staphylococcus devriesei]
MIYRGVKKYPKMIKEVQPTKHKYGADLTWSAHTDTFRPTLDGHGIDFEINAFKHNLNGTMLLNHQTDKIYEDEIKKTLGTGVLDAGAYFRAAEELQPQVDWLIKVLGKKPSYWSYAYGQRDHDDFVLKNGLISRLSSDKETSYDFSDRLGHPNSSLFNYNVRDNNMTVALNNSEKNLQKAIENNGWFNDFSHWHWAEFYGDKNQWSQFMERQKSLLSNINYVSLGASEAVEYMWLRKQFKRGGLYESDNDLVLLCETVNAEKLPYQAIDTTLSVKVDTSGTILEGKDITGPTQIIKIDTNQYIVQVPYKKMSGFSTIRFKETNNPNYVTRDLPKVKNAVLKGAILNIETDVPTKLAVFTTDKGAELYTATVIGRRNIFSTTHSIRLDDITNKDIYIGINSETKQSILQKV